MILVLAEAEKNIKVAMVHRIVISSICFLLASVAFAQGNIQVFAPEKLAVVINSRIAERDKTKKMDGYRYLVFFNIDRTKAQLKMAEVKNKLGSNMEVSIRFDEPYFKVFAGTYKSRFDAYLDRGRVYKFYNGANLVQDKVPFPPVP